MQITTNDIGALVSNMLDLARDRIDNSTGDDAVYLNGVSDADESNLKLMLSNGQVFTIRIIAGDR